MNDNTPAYLRLERKLSAHRAKKKREALFNNVKTKLLKMIPFMQDNVVLEIPEVKEIHESIKSPIKPEKQVTFNVVPKLETITKRSTSPTMSDDVCSGDEETVSNDPIEESKGMLDYILYVIYFALWATTFAIFIQFGFGMVWLLCSGIVGMYLNTRTRPKLKGEVSAYSVFNKNCERIKGSLSAEDFEREMVYGSFSAMQHH